MHEQSVAEWPSFADGRSVHTGTQKTGHPPSVSTFSDHTDHRRRNKLVSGFLLLHIQIQVMYIIIARAETEVHICRSHRNV